MTEKKEMTEVTGEWLVTSGQGREDAIRGEQRRGGMLWYVFKNNL